VLQEFKTFITRGNLVDLAVAVVLGVAFQAVVTSLVEDLFTPLLAALFGKPDFSDLTFTINDSIFRYGSFINALISFLSIAAVIFFFVVKPMNHLMARLMKEPADDEHRKCPECLSEIPREATRCAFCTAESPPEPAPASE
jgi:large conductance mechanosensitive channel